MWLKLRGQARKDEVERFGDAIGKGSYKDLSETGHHWRFLR